MTKSLIFWVIILIAGLGLIISANFFRDTNPLGNLPVLIQTPSPTLEPVNQPTPKPTASPKSVVAACQLNGEIKFIKQNLYETKDAKISYQNVDDPTRQIFWKFEPNDETLAVGPNLFEELPLPSGQREIGVALKNNPTSKFYTLTAAITYGARDSNGDIEVRNADCTGKITVDMSKI
ncbi:MAG: hypothetical protein AAB338_02780 [Patescibacteria group bacterium]